MATDLVNPLIEVGVGAVGVTGTGLTVYFVNQISGLQRHISKLELHIAEEYVKRDEIHRALAKLEENIKDDIKELKTSVQGIATRLNGGT